jgi:predicted Rossmann fold nucleotide-binding protein DprA/Smf involved in DNA uptake
MGDPAILRHRLLGFICSIQCPGSIVIKTLDAIRMLRDAGVTVVGGFHSPMEKECLDILLRGNQPVILCAAKGLVGLRIGQTPREAVKDGRLLIVSPFAANVRRTTPVRAIQRNDLVATLADALLVPYVAPGGKAWTAARNALARRQTVYTFAGEENSSLISSGAKPIEARAIINAFESHAP